MNKAPLGLALSCALAAVVGYAISRSAMVAGESISPSSATRLNPRTGDAMEKPLARENERNRTPKSPKQLANLRNDLLQQFKNNPATVEDWAFREHIEGILDGLSEEELHELLKNDLIPPEPGVFRSWNTAERDFFNRVVRHWATLNPQGTCRTLLGIDSGGLEIAFAQWNKIDPDAASEWLAQVEFSESSEIFKRRLIGKALDRQVTRDFSAAKEALTSLNMETQNQVLLSWSVLVARDSSRRQEFLELLASRGDQEFTAKCFESLVKEMARQSPAEAAAFVEGSDLPEDKKDELSHALLGQWALTQPKEAFAAWAELKEDSAPELLLKAIESWGLNFPGVDESVGWVKSLESGPAREQFKNHLIGHMTTFERFAQAADLSASLEDPAERIRQLKIVKRVWQERWKPGCDAWFAKLPKETRAAVEGE